MTKRKVDPIDDLTKRIMDYVVPGAAGPNRALQTEYVQTILRLAYNQGATAALLRLRESTPAPAQKT